MSLNNKGFTIIELLLATTFFSVILMMVTAGFIQINRSYTKGNIVRTLQNNGRVVFEDITRNLREAEAFQYTGSQLCVAGVRYDWTAGDVGLSKAYDSLPCGDAMPADSVSSLDDNTVVQHLEAQAVSASSVRLIMVISTPNADIDATTRGTADATCLTGNSTQYCDVARFETVVTMRN